MINERANEDSYNYTLIAIKALAICDQRHLSLKLNSFSVSQESLLLPGTRFNFPDHAF